MSKIKDWGKGLVKNTWEGFKNSTFGGGVIKAYQKATNSLKNTWDIVRQGASQAWDNTKRILPTVTNITEKTASGIKNIAGGIGGYLKMAVVESVKTPINSLFAVGGFVKKIDDRIARWYNEKREKRRKLLKELKTRIKSYFVGNPLPEEIKPLTKITRGVYGDNNIDLPDGIRKIVNRNELQKYGLTPEMLRDDKSGFLAGVYINDLTGELIIAYAGTKLTSLRDWITNFGQGLGFYMKQYQEAGAIADIVKEKIKNGEIDAQKVLFVGHSLGGGLAALSGAVTGVKTITFNAAGVHNNTLRKAGVFEDDIQSHNFPNITNYVHRGEILTHIQEDGLIGFLAPNALGQKTKFGSRWYKLIPSPFKATKVVDSAKRHSLSIK